MIIMLGQGLLYDVHTRRQHLLTLAERRRAIIYSCCIMVILSLSILLWIL
jgi:hypothetical protein